jgi:membrane associated rhomboid family serine protease
MLFPLRDHNPTRRPPLVTYSLVGINVAVLLYMTAMSEPRRELFVIEHGFIPARIEHIGADQPLQVQIESLRAGPQGQVVRSREVVDLPTSASAVLATLFTCMFMHGGWMHLIGNMWFLALFGNNIEDRLGHVLFLIFYLVGGLLASGGQLLQNPESHIPMIGASGAVAAVLGAYIITYPHARVHTFVFLGFFFTFIELPALFVLGMWFFGQLFAARADLGNEVGQGVAFFAHVAGFAAGVLMMFFLKNLVPHDPLGPDSEPDYPSRYYR